MRTFNELTLFIIPLFEICLNFYYKVTFSVPYSRNSKLQVSLMKLCVSYTEKAFLECINMSYGRCSDKVIDI